MLTYDDAIGACAHHYALGIVGDLDQLLEVPEGGKVLQPTAALEVGEVLRPPTSR
jgi:hypothetical protein